MRKLKTFIEKAVAFVIFLIHLFIKESPKIPIHFEERHNYHTWKKEEDGEIDEFAFMGEICNGPVCEVCGYSFCKHCNPDGYKDTNCVRSWYGCPYCGEKVSYGRKRCDCGQVLKWEEDGRERGC